MNDGRNIPVAYAHQNITTKFIVDTKQCLITSDPGTGKTRAVLDAHVILGGRTLVLAPLSILEAAWGEDIHKFHPQKKYGVAYAKNRKQIKVSTNLGCAQQSFFIFSGGAGAPPGNIFLKIS